MCQLSVAGWKYFRTGMVFLVEVGFKISEGVVLGQLLLWCQTPDRTNITVIRSRSPLAHVVGVSVRIGTFVARHMPSLSAPRGLFSR